MPTDDQSIPCADRHARNPIQTTQQEQAAYAIQALRSPPPSTTSASASIRWSTTTRASNPPSGASPATMAPSDRVGTPQPRQAWASRAPRLSSALRRWSAWTGDPTHPAQLAGLPGRVRPARPTSSECPVEWRRRALRVRVAPHGSRAQSLTRTDVNQRHPERPGLARDVTCRDRALCRRSNRLLLHRRRAALADRRGRRRARLSLRRASPERSGTSGLPTPVQRDLCVLPKQLSTTHVVSCERLHCVNNMRTFTVGLPEASLNTNVSLACQPTRTTAFRSIAKNALAWRSIAPSSPLAFTPTPTRVRRARRSCF
jgi:hypothetical protein